MLGSVRHRNLTFAIDMSLPGLRVPYPFLDGIHLRLRVDVIIWPHQPSDASVSEYDLDIAVFRPAEHKFEQAEIFVILLGRGRTAGSGGAVITPVIMQKHNLPSFIGVGQEA